METITISQEEYDQLLYIRDLHYKSINNSVKKIVSAKKMALYCLDRIKGSNITFKEFAETTGFKLNTIYAWHQRQNIPESNAKFLIDAI